MNPPAAPGTPPAPPGAPPVAPVAPGWAARLALGSARLLAKLPVRLLLAIGAGLGRVIYVLSARTRARIQDNIRNAGVAGPEDADVRRFARRCAAELGRSLFEAVPLWFGRAEEMLARVRLGAGWDAVQALQREGRGIIYLTPHLGGFELAGQFLAHRMRVTIMYRPPRLEWLDPLLRAGRAQGQAELTTADMRGVRASLKALKRGDSVGLLPDQVPAPGHGIYAAFFGRPAYTTTLIGKLQQATGAHVVLMACIRLPAGAGYELSFHPLAPLPAEEAAAVRALNVAQEAVIRLRPEQYLWSYNRYKRPVAME